MNPRIVEFMNARSLPSSSVSNLPITEVLVVDDDPVAYTQVMLTIKRLGVERISYACNGAEAIEHLCHNVPSLIFLDLEMPVMDGLEFLDVFHGNNPDWDQIPVVVLSSMDCPQIMEKAFAYDKVKDFLKKPYNLKKIKAVLDTVISEPNSPQHCLSKNMDKAFTDDKVKDFLMKPVQS